MPVRFTVLASGSSGNASLLETDDFGLLIDAGLGPRQLASRLTAMGLSWQKVHAVVLTHTHCDHWSEATLKHLWRSKIPFYCHARHHDTLTMSGTAFEKLRAGDLVHGYRDEANVVFSPTLSCRPLPLSHDGVATFG